MRRNSIYYWLVVASMTMALLVVLPEALRMVTQRSQHMVLLSYSHVLGQIGRLDYTNKDYPLVDKEGRRYTLRETDSIYPLNSFRQLMIDGRMPDSILGQEATMRNIAAKQVITRHDPWDGHDGSLSCGMNILYENMPKRVGIELPGDLFVMGDRMEFIGCDDLKVDEKKSVTFTETIKRSGFKFPSLAVWANNSPRKRYDNGVFAMDSDSSLFHIMMVNNRPFVRHIEMPWDFHIADMSPFEANDKSIYGFLFGTDGKVALLSPADDGGYDVQVFEQANGDISKNRVQISGNLASWTINVINDETITAYAYDRNSLKLLDTMVEKRGTTTMVEKVASALVPVHLHVGYRQSGKEYVDLEIGDSLGLSWVIAVLIGIAYYGIKGRKRGTRGVVYTVIICLTGLSGLVAIALVPKETE
ncbi:MAG: DUF4857 domain-containing protein [Bacteroidales bacterium]|nr:DUF4857 domain-containing protein [Bacteroidales bacterium]